MLATADDTSMIHADLIDSRARAFLARDQHPLFIDGQWRSAQSGRTIETRDPSTGRVIGSLAAGEAADIDLAVRAARAAFQGEWRRWSPYERQKLLHRIHDAMERHWEELAFIESVDMGAPIARTRASKAAILRMILFFAGQCANFNGETVPNGLPGDVMTMTIKAPAGVVGGIIPWNGPLGGQWWVIGAALATGCTIVLKPAEDASLSVIRTAEILQEVGLPAGVLNVVTGLGHEAGAALAAHPDVDRIAFTGSTVTGRKIIEASAGNIKKLQLELGGKSPDIVFADADLDKAVPGASMGVFANSGQICFAGTRVFVQRPVIEEFCQRAAAFASTIKVGRSLDPDAQLGPLISSRQLDRVLSYIRLGNEEGAKLVCGGERLGGGLADGYFVPPTVFAGVDNAKTIAREEIFGPVMSVIPFDTLEDAVALGNQTEYGLGGAVWSRDISTALKVVNGIQSGVMWVNCYGLIDPLVGFGGSKHSGYGAKGGRDHLDTYLTRKTVYIDT
jgi:aldehyde dehydrogenase (NAD+)